MIPVPKYLLAAGTPRKFPPYGKAFRLTLMQRSSGRMATRTSSRDRAITDSMIRTLL